MCVKCVDGSVTLGTVYSTGSSADCVERLLADLVKEENALLAKTSTPTYRLILIRCRGTLSGIHNQIRLLRAVSYRILLLGDVQSNEHSLFKRLLRGKHHRRGSSHSENCEEEAVANRRRGFSCAQRSCA
jgi:hypothetical protein